METEGKEQRLEEIRGEIKIEKKGEIMEQMM
jgi:hypothetical protein